MRHFKTTAAGFTVLALGLAALAISDERTQEKKAGPVLRASALTGMNVVNSRNEDLGKVDDVVIDMGTGKVRYAAVSFGGFLGIGDKLFAVPFQAFQVTSDPDDRDSTRLILNVDKQTLEQAPGFDKDHWPNFGDPNFGARNDRYFLPRATRN